MFGRHAKVTMFWCHAKLFVFRQSVTMLYLPLSCSAYFLWQLFHWVVLGGSLCYTEFRSYTKVMGNVFKGIKLFCCDVPMLCSDDPHFRGLWSCYVPDAVMFKFCQPFCSAFRSTSCYAPMLLLLEGYNCFIPTFFLLKGS